MDSRLNEKQLTGKVGESPRRKDAFSKVTGAACYTADVALEKTAFGVLVRSPHHHALVKNITTLAALAVPGVIAVLTSADVPAAKVFGPIIVDQPVLALERVRHVGEPVALVVAETREIAERAAALVEVSYDILDAVLDPRAALKPGAPLVQDGGNLLTQYEVVNGDTQTGFAQADLIFEDDFSVQRISPGYMETENSLARYNPDGSLTVWVNSQKPFDDQATIASVLGLPAEKVQVMGAMVGGAFGGKEDSSISVLTSLAAWCTRRTVRLVNRRHESFVAHPKRHPAVFHLKIGAKKDGTLLALQADVFMDTGAYASYGTAVGGLLTEMVPGSYNIPNVSVTTHVVYTHSPYSGAMRGFGSPQAHFALESALDMLAEKLGIDPLDLRRKNILHPGDKLFTQVVLDNSASSLEHILEAVAAARERLQKIPTPSGKVSGVGFALGMQSMGLGAKILDQSSHRLEWMPDGRVSVILGAPDLGQGLATVAEQMVSTTLELPFDQVVTEQLDTLTTPNGGVTCASRMTYLAGNALLAAAEQLRENLLSSAAQLLNLPKTELTYRQGQIITGQGKKYPVSEFSSRMADNGQVLQAEGTATFPYPEDSTPQHLPIGMPHVKFVFAADVARVELDPQLGTVKVTDIEAIHDVGRVINRATLEGQIEGGVAMGVGYALYEDMPLKADGRWVDSFSEYLLPTALDAPAQIKSTILEIPDESGPFGAKGVAELVVTPVAPAIANAVYAAGQIRVKDLPITAEKLVIKG
ncbi:MAG: xanthine dehydrogenase family protein molybdopterin-binding subunit [Anaerolineae bacterium]|nr:xanthine dehydrogenase family protein molybdopterin-binding subunit [Anaerolineae bacterium]